MRTLNDALVEVQIGIQDAKADYPDLGEDDIVAEVVRNVASSYPMTIACELLRRYGH